MGIIPSRNNPMVKSTFLFLSAMLCVNGAAAASKLIVDPPSFVRVAGGDFVDGDCRAIDRLSGYNSFMLVEAAAGKCCGGRSAVDAQFDEAAARGLTLVRFFAFAVLDSAALQKSGSPGGRGMSSYDEALLDGLDYVVAAAGLRGLRLVAVFANNWDYSSWKGAGRRPPSSDTKCWYTNATAALGPGPAAAAAAATGCDDFWSNGAARALYKRHLEFITGRVNRYTGLRWRDDPTIFANELFNEPRCEALPEERCAPALQSFVEDASAALKAADANHLVTVGEDGFFGRHSCLADLANPVPSRGYRNIGPPGSGWPIQTGQDCVANHAPESIDFIAIHLWPENWKRSDAEFVLPWLRAHAEAARLLRKPVLLEEFGKAGVARNGNNNGNRDRNNGKNGDSKKRRNGTPGGVGTTTTTTSATTTIDELWGDEEEKLRAYRLVYRSVAEEFRDTIKGVLFWRWGAVRTDGDLGDFDRASLVETDSAVFREVVEPFSREAAAAKPSSSTGNSKRRRRIVRECKVDERRLPFVVVDDVAVPRAPGAPGIEAAKKVVEGEKLLPPPLSPPTSKVEVSTASVASAGRKRRRRRLASSSDASYLPPPAILGPFWMGSGRKIDPGSLEWIPIPRGGDGSGRGGGAGDGEIEKMSGPTTPTPAPGAGGGGRAEIASTPSAAPDPSLPLPPRPKIDAREINALISCANLQL